MNTESPAFSSAARNACTTVCRGLLCGLLLLTFSGLALASEPDLPAQLDKIEYALKHRAEEIQQLSRLAGEATVIKGKALDCVEQTTETQAEVQKTLDSLGKPEPDEPREVRRTRQEVKAQLTKVGQRQAACRVLVLRSNNVLAAISERTKQILANNLLARGPDVVSLLRDNWQQPRLWLSSTSDFIRTHSGLAALGGWQWILALLGFAAGAGLGIGLRFGLRHQLSQRPLPSDFAASLVSALLATLARYAPVFLASSALAATLYILTRDQQLLPFVTLFVAGLPPLIFFYALVAFLLVPPPPSKPFLDIPENLAHALLRCLRMLAVLSFIGYLLFSTLLVQSLPESALQLARGLFALFLITNLAWAFRLLARLPSVARLRWLMLLVSLMLVIILFCEWAGYRNLSLALTVSLLGSLLIFGLALLFQRLLRDFFAGIEQGKWRWSQNLRRTLGLEMSAPVPGLRWLRLASLLLLWGLFGYFLLKLWDVTDTLGLDLYTLATQGFEIGTYQVVPVRILVALLSALLVILLGSWLRGRLASGWLERTGMERGAREALVTMTGYITVAVAVIVGLGVTGFEFRNIAIIAGALSVGIGFGLQNIVNNFVSGLILLFERPIKTGDWIMVGNTEGYVKRIRIRSTRIQTFDRADVIVPNSELISAQVTNWMLKDAEGRIRVPVGVAYGTDTARVKDILEHVAAEHPMVITDGHESPPWVLFRGFGDSALDFELRCFIRNIDRRLRVISDLNFSIDAAFREAGIEIPFPQRDLHVKDWSATTPATPPKQEQED